MTESSTETVEQYVAADGVTRLDLHVCSPVGRPRAAVLLFHGGGWMKGAPSMLLPHARRLADAGILVASSAYRLVGSGAASPADCLADAARADRAFRRIAAEAGLDRIAIGGGSAGAQLALALAMPPDPGEPYEYEGLVLLNPAVDMCCGRGLLATLSRRLVGLTSESARVASPLHHVRRGVPRSLVLHGTRDRIVPLRLVRAFREAMAEAGNDCDLVEFEGAGHGFFLPRPEGDAAFDRTAELIAQFLLAPTANPDGDDQIDEGKYPA